MRFLFKTLFRTAVIGTALTAAVVGGTAMIVGPDRVGAMAEQIQDGIEHRIDARIDDPIALRRQIASAAAQYPARIKDVRADLVSLQDEMRRLEREQVVSEKVVTLVDRDLQRLAPAVKELQRERAEGGAVARLAALEVDGEVLSFARATARVREIERTRLINESRAADAEHNLKYLRNQEQRFVELLDQLEGEHAQFQAQLVQLQAEVESIARNERLIEMLEKRQRTFDEVSVFEARSLDQIIGAMERKRTEQEAELDQLAAGVQALSYEEMAAAELRAAGSTAVGAQALSPKAGR